MFHPKWSIGSMTPWKKIHCRNIQNLYGPQATPAEKNKTKIHPTEQTHQTHHQYSIRTIQQNPQKKSGKSHIKTEHRTSSRQQPSSPSSRLFHALRVGGPRTPMKLSFLLSGWKCLRSWGCFFTALFWKIGVCLNKGQGVSQLMVELKIELNPSWKICSRKSSKWVKIHLPPIFGVKINKYLSCHHPSLCLEPTKTGHQEGVDIPQQDWCLPEDCPPHKIPQKRGKWRFWKGGHASSQFCLRKVMMFFLLNALQEILIYSIWYILRFLKITPWL